MIFELVLAIVTHIGCALEVAPGENEGLYCLFSRASNLDDWEHLADEVANGAVNVETSLAPVTPVSVRCVNPQSHCVAIWTVRENKTEMLIQGCWNVVQDACSGPDVCSSGNRVFQPSRNGYPAYMCCCRPSNCNRIDRVVVGPLHRQLINETFKKSTREEIQQRDSRITLLIWTSSLFSVLILLLATRRYYRTRRREELESPDIPQRMSIIGDAAKPWSMVGFQSQEGTPDEESLLEDSDPFLASLQLGERIGGGHFADVYRASSSMGDVAVKVYHANQKTFDNEYDNLTLLQSLKHPNIIQMICAVVAEKRLVLQLYAGSLHSLLEECSLNFTDFFDCAIDISDGLAFLHSHTNGATK